MTNSDCWAKLEKISEELDKLMKREREIEKEGGATTNLQLKRRSTFYIAST